MVSVPSVRICSGWRSKRGRGGERSRWCGSVVRSRVATGVATLHCPPLGSLLGRGSRFRERFVPVENFMRREASPDGYRSVSTTLRGCPHVVHRFIHRMADHCAQRRVIHNPQFTACIKRLGSELWGHLKGQGASYPQAEVIHRPWGLGKSHTLWTTGCPGSVHRSCRSRRHPHRGRPRCYPSRARRTHRAGTVGRADLTGPWPGRIFFMLMPFICACAR